MKYASVCLIVILITVYAGAQTPVSFNHKSSLMQPNQPENGEESSPAKYVLLSLVLPGAGEWFIGNRGMAKIFFGTEFLLWAGYFGTQAYVDILKDDFQSYAALHAGVTTAGKDDRYWINIGSAENIFTYNEQMRVRRNLDETYPETGEFDWNWDSREDRARYNQLRVKQHDWDRRLTFVVSGLVLNRIVSAIDVVRIIRKQSRENQNRQSMLYFNYDHNRLRGETYSLNMKFWW